MFVSRVEKTSVRVLGAASPAMSCRCNVIGKTKLAVTAHRAAINVLSIYCDITVRKRGPKPLLAFAMLAVTRTATKTGAIAFKALTNIVPRILIAVH